MGHALLKILSASLCFALVIAFGGCSSLDVLGTDRVTMIAKEDLKALLDDPDTTIIDVRHDSDWEESSIKIKGAVHEDPLEEEASWAGNYPKDKNIVLY